MKVIGIDPGTTVTGYGVLHVEGSQIQVIDYGCIRPPRKEKTSTRRHIIFDGICHLIQKHEPEVMSVETQFVHPQNPLSAITLGMVRGIAILAATQHAIPTFEYSPAKVKRAVSGNGRASKQQIVGMMERLLSCSISSEDAADALAIAFCHLNARNHGVEI